MGAESTVIEREGRLFEVYTYNDHAGLRDWCSKCSQGIQTPTDIVEGVTLEQMRVRLERAIRKRLKQVPSMCPECSTPAFKITELIDKRYIADLSSP